MAVEFFSAVDKKRNQETGEMFISSEHPAWYLPASIRDIEEEINMKRRRLESGQVPERRKGEVRADLSRLEKKLDLIKNAMPKRDEKTVDECGKIEKELSKVLRDLLDPREKQKKGLVNHSRLADRMHSPVVEVPAFIAETAAANGMRVVKGKISQNDVQRLWKYARRFNEQDSRVELLRRD